MYRILIFSVLCLLMLPTVLGQNKKGTGPSATPTAQPVATAQPTPAASPTLPEKPQPLTPVTAYLWCALGIILSIVLPILRAMLPKPPTESEAKSMPVALSYLRRIWPVVRPYLIIGLFSLFTAVLIIAAAGSSIEEWTWNIAVLTGYAWDSTLQKVGAVAS